MRLAILSTDTPHHRYFFHKINKIYPIDTVFLETSSYKPKFDISSPFEREEKEFEQKKFFKSVSNSLIKKNLYYFETLNTEEAINELKKAKA